MRDADHQLPPFLIGSPPDEVVEYNCIVRCMRREGGQRLPISASQRFRWLSAVTGRAIRPPLGDGSRCRPILWIRALFMRRNHGFLDTLTSLHRRQISGVVPEARVS
jgi:hypothetical protein